MNDFTNIRRIEIARKLDFQAVPQLEKQVAELLDAGITKIVCDFTVTEYVSSAGLRILLSTLKRIDKAGGSLALYGLKPGVLEIFNMVGFIDLFEICDSQEAALKQVQIVKALSDPLSDGQKEAAAALYCTNSLPRQKLDEKA